MSFTQIAFMILSQCTILTWIETEKLKNIDFKQKIERNEGVGLIPQQNQGAIGNSEP